ncbi:hypothetical protein N9518_05530 [Candidatus Pelagibacter sp.]|nr:hypothetical protein [Candidatus Pelagibacter sp.]
MNIGNGLKAIINVGCGLWMIIGTIVILGGFNQSSSGQIYVGVIFGLVAPIIIRFVIFYIINSFK